MRLLPYAQLLRIPNVFTAFADILLGGLAAGTLLARPLPSAALLLASGCLYCAGMVWNDWFDFETDRKERPFRPLPSGRIASSAALRIAIGLTLMGLTCAAAADIGEGGFRSQPLGVALALTAAILLYNGWLKNTPAGPIAMGACRFLNVLLGVSLADAAAMPVNHRLHLALVVGIYIAGVTWFARQEAGRSSASHLRGAAGVMLLALLLALALPTRRAEGTVWIGFPYVLVAFGFFIGLPLTRAIKSPDPKNVQTAVKRCVLGLIVLDAVAASVYVGEWGLLIALLLPPALLLGRRVYST